MENQQKKRAAQGLPPSENWGHKLRRKKMEGIRRMMGLQEDVMYLMIVNMPTEEELQEAVAEMQYLMEHQKDSELEVSLGLNRSDIARWYTR